MAMKLTITDSANATGNTKLLEVSIKMADHIDGIFGQGKRVAVVLAPGLVAGSEAFIECGQGRELLGIHGDSSYGKGGQWPFPAAWHRETE